ncbi:MAG: hypothetical protein H6672_20695 [Anaerolineaceae bacterium]|nr:hypothetical protein [Anaerolineaceae bacterium]
MTSWKRVNRTSWSTNLPSAITDSVFASIAWSADGLRLAGADNQGGIHIWSVTKRQSSTAPGAG